MRMPRSARPLTPDRHTARRPSTRLGAIILLACAALILLATPARADIVEQPADGFTLRCQGMELRAVGGPAGGGFLFASALTDNPDGSTRYVETVTASEVRLTDPASGAAYTIGGVDGSQGSTLDTVILGEQIIGRYHAHWIVRAADGSVAGVSDILIDYATGATVVTGSCG